MKIGCRIISVVYGITLSVHLHYGWVRSSCLPQRQLSKACSSFRKFSHHRVMSESIVRQRELHIFSEKFSAELKENWVIDHEMPRCIFHGGRSVWINVFYQVQLKLQLYLFHYLTDNCCWCSNVFLKLLIRFINLTSSWRSPPPSSAYGYTGIVFNWWVVEELWNNYVNVVLTSSIWFSVIWNCH